jgi:hypothetical protein
MKLTLNIRLVLFSKIFDSHHLPSKLLEDLKTTSDKDSVAVASLENIGVTGSSSNAKLVVVVALDLIKLRLDGFMGWVQLAKPGERLQGTIVIALLDQITGGLWQDHHTTSKDGSPDELNGNWNSVRAMIGAVVSGLIDTSSQKKTDGDGKLVGTNNGSSDPFWRRLRLVEWDNGRDETDTESSNSTTGSKERDGGSGSLEGNTDLRSILVSSGSIGGKL